MPPALAAAASAALALFLALHHPLSPALALLGCAALGGLAFWRPLPALALLPVLLPAIDLMPWTGWLTFEEFDIAVLAVAAGAYARRLLERPEARPAGGATALKGLLITGYAAALLVSLLRGFADAGGLVWGWWQGYQESMNSLRLLKPYFLACLVLPLWTGALRAQPQRSARAFALGMAGGLGVVALLLLWERWANTGLGNFSSDYRTTALFWEMHVGGAALDGFLALTMPFAVRELLRAHSARRWFAAALIVLIGAYGCLTTFSRDVYIGVPAALITMTALAAQQRTRSPASAGTAATTPWLATILVWLLFAGAVAWTFPSGGYRVMLALLGAVPWVLAAPARLRSLWFGSASSAPAPRAAAAVLGAGGVAALLLTLAALALPKGPYLVYALVWSACALAAMVLRRRPARALAIGYGAALVALIGLVPTVAGYWGGAAARTQALPAAAVLALLAAWGCASRRPRWPDALRWQGTQTAALVVVGLVGGVLLGGSYMDDRFASGREDLHTRLVHWQHGVGLMNGGSDWFFGKGLGRYPANRFVSGYVEDEVGDYRLGGAGADRHLALSGGKHMLGWGEMLRLSQRVDAFEGPVTVRARVGADAPVTLQFELCRKHLLYDNGSCRVASARVVASAGQTQAIELQLTGPGLDHGDWFAPNFIVFSVAVADSGRAARIAELSATDARGRELLENRDFSAGMSRWFFSSDKYHLPWHMKNLFLHLLLEQGAIGLGLFLALLAGAFWRLAAGRARDHELAPPLAGALVGFVVVGLFDSLLDVPRVAFLAYLLMLVALSLAPARPGVAARAP
ncbi:MAG: hypothetical protein KGN16_15205 [Burkholderiales bacterium]|nr:hypothetical protein [Burkholderiales bacterium]